MNPPQISPPDQMMQFITAKWISQPIQVAAQLGIADLLVDGPMSVEDLAGKTGTHAPTLYRLLRALAGRGIFEELEGRTFGLTPMAQCLQTGAMRALALTFLSDWHERAWGSLRHSVKTGEPAFDHAFGQPAFDWLEERPEESALFNQFQAEKTARFIPAVVEAYDFSGITKLADMGGGTGALMLEILRANPHLAGCVAELPQVARQAREAIQASGLADRCQAVECDFLQGAPEGFDAFIMCHTLHDWEDEACAKILVNFSRALPSGGKLLIVEHLIPEHSGFSVAKILDLEVLVMGGGKERTEAEYRALLQEASFQMNQVIETSAGIAIIEAERS
jgi:ubiquinone/menaquinone biosynthesis C-methylase UbiE